MAKRSRFSSEQSGGNGHHGQLPEWAAHQVEEHPLSSLCAVFASGFVLGVGLVVAYRASAGGQQSETWARRLSETVSERLPDALKDLQLKDLQALGQKQLGRVRWR